MSNYICRGKCLEQFNNIIEQDNDHEDHEKRKSRKMDHAFLLRRHSFAPHGLHQQEDQPSAVQGRDFSPLFLGDTSRAITRPDAALYIKNIDGEIDSAGMVRDYLPVARGLKTERYTLALYLDPATRQLDHALLFDDREDPYQLRNIPLTEDPTLTGELLARLAAELKTTGDPWYRDRILSDMLPYEQ